MDHFAAWGGGGPSINAGAVEPEETAVTRQQLCKNVPAETFTHTTIEALSDVDFSARSVLYQTLNMQ
jgi:hypothetical protein